MHLFSKLDRASLGMATVMRDGSGLCGTVRDFPRCDNLGSSVGLAEGGSSSCQLNALLLHRYSELSEARVFVEESVSTPLWGSA